METVHVTPLRALASSPSPECARCCQQEHAGCNTSSYLGVPANAGCPVYQPQNSSSSSSSTIWSENIYNNVINVINITSTKKSENDTLPSQDLLPLTCKFNLKHLKRLKLEQKTSVGPVPRLYYYTSLVNSKHTSPSCQTVQSLVAPTLLTTNDKNHAEKRSITGQLGPHHILS